MFGGISCEVVCYSTTGVLFTPILCHAKAAVSLALVVAIAKAAAAAVAVCCCCLLLQPVVVRRANSQTDTANFGGRVTQQLGSVPDEVA
jgi:hypothetical protein